MIFPPTKFDIQQKAIIDAIEEVLASTDVHGVVHVDPDRLDEIADLVEAWEPPVVH